MSHVLDTGKDEAAVYMIRKFMGNGRSELMPSKFSTVDEARLSMANSSGGYPLDSKYKIVRITEKVVLEL